MNCVILISFLLQLYGFSGANSLPESRIEIIKAGQKALMNGSWNEARKLFRELYYRDTTDPVGYLMRAAALHAEMMDREENLYEDEFKNLCDSIGLSAEKKMTACSSSDSALYFLCLGHRSAYRSLWETRFGSTISSISYGMKARRKYQAGLKCDSTLYDLYLGLGSYHYWKSVKSGILKFTGLLKDEKEKGIREVRLAADSALFSRATARSSLIWILINERQYDSAIDLCREMLAEYPDGNSFLWPLAEGYYKSGNYDSSAAVYGRLLERLRSHPGNYYNVIEAAYYLGQSYDKKGQEDNNPQLRQYLNSIYDDIPSAIRRKQKSKIRVLTGRH
nr:hypothetical protein [candidate division Zixibacteria bacterium]